MVPEGKSLQGELRNAVAQGWAARCTFRGVQRHASPEPTLLSTDPPLCLLTFHFTGSGLHDTSTLHPLEAQSQLPA